MVQLIGKETLGFGWKDVGLHLIFSGGAMAMFLLNILTVIIQRDGSWPSEAFLECIQDQVESFTLRVSQKMISCENFRNLILDKKEKVKEKKHQKWRWPQLQSSPSKL